MSSSSKTALSAFDRAAIACRLRELLLATDKSRDLGILAASLGLEEVSLRMSIDEDSPHPTVEVLAAVIREFGIDPTWLLTGEYDAATHRTAMNEGAKITAELRARLHQRPHTFSEPPQENVFGHTQN